MLTQPQFDRIRRLASRLAGIELLERHQELVQRRGRRTGLEEGLQWDALLTAAEAGETSATHRLIHLLTTKYTAFFRHPRHFEAAAQRARVGARERGQARLWSAAAATGEEPFSLAMAIIDAFAQDEPPVTILATDVDEIALDAARRGEYGPGSLADLEPSRRRFLTGNSGDGRRTIGPEARRLVSFLPLNLAAPDWPIHGPFDAIFCRNVLMYLEAEVRVSALHRIASLLASDGVLILDPTEHLGLAASHFSPLGDGLFRRAGPVGSAPAESSVSVAHLLSPSSHDLSPSHPTAGRFASRGADCTRRLQSMATLPDRVPDALRGRFPDPGAGHPG